MSHVTVTVRIRLGRAKLKRFQKPVRLSAHEWERRAAQVRLDRAA